MRAAEASEPASKLMAILLGNSCLITHSNIGIHVKGCSKPLWKWVWTKLHKKKQNDELKDKYLVISSVTGPKICHSHTPYFGTKRLYLSVFVQDVSKEAVGVGESLRACTLPHTDHSVLLRMQNTALKLKDSGVKLSVPGFKHSRVFQSLLPIRC